MKIIQLKDVLSIFEKKQIRKAKNIDIAGIDFERELQSLTLYELHCLYMLIDTKFKNKLNSYEVVIIELVSRGISQGNSLYKM